MACQWINNRTETSDEHSNRVASDSPTHLRHLFCFDVKSDAPVWWIIGIIRNFLKKKEKKEKKEKKKKKKKKKRKKEKKKREKNRRKEKEKKKRRTEG